MSNLIITIISIALAAVVAIAAIWYGGSAFAGSNAKTQAVTLIEQTKQVKAALTMYSLDNGGAGFNDFSELTVAQLGTYFGLGAQQFIPVLQTQPPAGSGTGNGVEACSATVGIIRTHCATTDGKNLIAYKIMSNTANSGCTTGSNTDYTLAASAQDSMGQICLAINQIIGATPSGSTISASGIPTVTGTLTSCGSVGNAYLLGQYNYCYVLQGFNTKTLVRRCFRRSSYRPNRIAKHRLSVNCLLI